MVKIFVRHKLADWDTWKKVFDEFHEVRTAAGETGVKLFRNAHDEHEMLGLFTWDTTERAQAFFESTELKEAMERAGATGEPDIVFLSEV